MRSRKLGCATFGSFKGVSKSVQAPVNGMEAVMGTDFYNSEMGVSKNQGPHCRTRSSKVIVMRTPPHKRPPSYSKPQCFNREPHKGCMLADVSLCTHQSPLAISKGLATSLCYGPLTLFGFIRRINKQYVCMYEYLHMSCFTRYIYIYALVL